MSSDQPEASTSTSSPNITARHLATFVFDSSLPRPKYTKLIEADGVVHKLVQRLMEKHGGENNLRISLLITSHSRQTTGGEKEFRQEFGRPSAFLTSLPGLSDYFPNPGSFTGRRKWPRFSVEAFNDNSVDADSAREKKRKRGAEADLLRGVVGGLELLRCTPADQRRFPPRTLLTLTPSTATPLFDSLTVPSQIPGKASLPVSTQRYLIVIGPNGNVDTGSNDVDSTFHLWSEAENWDTAWDGKSWNDLAESCKARGYRCSCVLVGSNEDGQTASKKLRSLCAQASSAPLDAPWFDVPPDIETMLSGYSMESVDNSTAPTPLLDMASTVGTDQVETPVSNPSFVPDARTMQQMQNQAMQARMAQIARAISASTMNGGKMDPQLMQAISAAMKTPNGNMDMNDPRWQQIRQMLQMHQQRQVTNVSPNINSAVSGPASGLSNEQAVMAAIQQQRALQAQNGAGQSTITQNTQSAGKPGQHVLWSGTMSWGGQPANNAQVIHLEATHFTGGMEGLLLNQWPQDLRLQTIVTIDLPTLTSYARSMKAPCVTFAPSSSCPDPSGNTNRYSQLVNSLNQKGNMVVVPFSAPDRGIVLFSAPNPGPNSNAPKQCKMMGVICLAAPFPPLGPAAGGNAQNQNVQTIDNSSQIQPQRQQQLQQHQLRPSPLQAQGRLAPSQGGVGQYNSTPHQAPGQQQAIPTAVTQQHMQQQLQQLQQLHQPFPTPQQQFQQQQSFPQQQQQQQQPAAQEQRRGITQAQYNQIMDHAQKYGLNYGPFDYTTIPVDQVHMMLSGIKAAEGRLKLQQQQQLLQQQHQQQQQQQQQPPQGGQGQMQQLQQMLAQQHQLQQPGYGGYMMNGVGPGMNINMGQQGQGQYVQQ